MSKIQSIAQYHDTEMVKHGSAPSQPTTPDVHRERWQLHKITNGGYLAVSESSQPPHEPKYFREAEHALRYALNHDISLTVKPYKDNKDTPEQPDTFLATVPEESKSTSSNIFVEQSVRNGDSTQADSSFNQAPMSSATTPSRTRPENDTRDQQRTNDGIEVPESTPIVPIPFGYEERTNNLTRAGTRIYDAILTPPQVPNVPAPQQFIQHQLPLHDSSDERQLSTNAARPERIYYPTTFQSPQAMLGGPPEISSHFDCEIYNTVLTIQSVRVEMCRQSRYSLSRMPGEHLHGILSLSFSYITQYQTNPQQVLSDAELFLSAFETFNTQWVIDVDNLSVTQGQAIHGLTANSRNPSIRFRSVRFKFPKIHLEWTAEYPLSWCDSALSTFGATSVKTIWKAWSKSLVAYGFCDDSITLTVSGAPVISHRKFTVVNIFQPELMTPVPYPRDVPPMERKDDVAIFTSSQTFIQFLRSSQTRFSSLVALSALFASLQPVVSNFSTTGGWVFAAVGVFAALISVIAVIFAWMLKWAETNAARIRQG